MAYREVLLYEEEMNISILSHVEHSGLHRWRGGKDFIISGYEKQRRYIFGEEKRKNQECPGGKEED